MSGDYVGIDVGATQLRVVRVRPKTGRLLGKVFKKPLEEILTNAQLTQIVLEHVPRGSYVGISAAGVVDEERLIIVNSPNSNIRGEITVGQDLQKVSKLVVMTNDMRAAVSGMALYGEGKGYRRVGGATFSSGSNFAVAERVEEDDKIKIEIVTNAEVGHQKAIFRLGLPCGEGCGGMDHLETYVSGNGAALMAKKFFIEKMLGKLLRTGEKCPDEFLDHLIIDYALKEAKKTKLKLTPWNVLDSIEAKHIYDAYRLNPNQEPQKTIRSIQIESVADYFGRMVSSFNPLDIIVCMGSQTNDWDILFEPAIDMFINGDYCLPTLHKPKIVKEKMREIGAQGAVAYSIIAT